MHCDLVEGGSSGHTTDWWDRAVAANMSWPRRSFTQEFVRAEKRTVEGPSTRRAITRWRATPSSLTAGRWATAPRWRTRRPIKVDLQGTGYQAFTLSQSSETTSALSA